MAEGKNPHNRNKKPKENYNLIRGISTWLLIFLGLIWLFNIFSPTMTGVMEKLSYGEFFQLLRSNINDPVIEKVTLTDNLIQGEFSDRRGGKRFYAALVLRGCKTVYR